jgi:hypothetical protein
VGDFRLENDRLALVVSDAPRAFGFAETGGHIIDAARRGGQDSISQVFLYLDDSFPRQALYDAVEVLRDEEEHAALLVRGRDSAAPHIAIATEIHLHRGDDHVTLKTTLHNQGQDEVRALEVGDVLQWGQAERFLPGIGFLFKGKTDVPWLAGIGEGVSYGYTPLAGTVAGPHGLSWSDTIVDTVDLPPGAIRVVERFFVVGERADVAGVLETMRTLRGEERAILTGVVREASGEAPPVASARVTLLDREERPIAVADTGPDGAYRFAVATGSYHIEVSAPGRADASTDAAPLVTLGAAPTTKDLRVTRPGQLAVRVTVQGAKTPCKLTLRGVAPTPDPSFGPRFRARGAANVILSLTGQTDVMLPPGRYTLWASRGLEYDLGVATVDVKAGENAPVALELHRVVDTTGALAGDFHQHALPSPDSSVGLVDRVTANLAEGIEVAIATDHNEITDYAPYVALIDARASLKTVVGLEATTESVGHFNAYPLVRAPRAGRGGAPAVHGLSPSEIFVRLRALATDVVVQVNHPRSGKSGYFRLFGFDPTAESTTLDLGFDALEVLNGKRLEEFDLLLKDWFWLLSHGHIVTATGGSDSHAIVGEECGYPRNYLGVGTDDPQTLTDAMLLAVVKRTRDVVVTNGPYVTLKTGGRSAIGQVLSVGKGDTVPVEIVVQAAPWVDVDRIEVYERGTPFGKPIPVTAGRDAVVRYRAVWSWPAKRDTWFVVVVRGSDALDPVVTPGDKPVTPIAVTNPVWLDVP